MKSFYTFSVLLICLLLLAACGTGKAAGSASSQGHNHKPTMGIKWEVAGKMLKVTVTTDLHISPEHYGKARQEGEGHIHMYLDDGEKIGVKTGYKEFPDLPAGKHTLKVSLHNNDHTPYDVTETFDFEIK